MICRAGWAVLGIATAPEDQAAAEIAVAAVVDMVLPAAAAAAAAASETAKDWLGFVERVEVAGMAFVVVAAEAQRAFAAERSTLAGLA